MRKNSDIVFEKNSRKKFAVISAVIILFILSSLSMLYFTSDNESFFYRYEVEISAPSEENWTAMVPFPSNENDSAEIFNNIHILSGNCSYELNRTEKGLALKITGKGDVSLRSSGNYLPYKYVRLSMRVRDMNGTKYWVWHDLNEKNISFIVDLYVESRYPGPFDFRPTSSTEIHDRLEGVAERGWNLILGQSESIVAD